MFIFLVIVIKRLIIILVYKNFIDLISKFVLVDPPPYHNTPTLMALKLDGNSEIGALFDLFKAFD